MNVIKNVTHKKLPTKLIFLFALWFVFGGDIDLNFAQAYYVYDIEAENERNARQDPEYGQPWYDKAAEDRRNARQKPKKNDFDKHCSTKKHPTKYCPERSPFIEMYFKDYSGVKNNPPFTRMYFKDYSDVKNDSEFTDRYLRDYSDY